MSFLLACLELTKPRLTLLVLVTTFIGFFLAAPAFETFSIVRLIHVLLGSTFLGGGMNTLNQYLERFIDAKMQRTACRPIPEGRIKDGVAFVLGLLLVIIGALWLIFFVGPLSGLLGLLTAFAYLLLYTPLKQITALNTFVGAIPGALPCLIGWTARQNELQWQAWTLFFILFFWQLPHFFAIAWVYKNDYDKSGLKMLTRHDADGRSTGRRIIASSLLLLPITFLPVWAGLAGNLYWVLSLVSGFFFLGAAFRLYRHQMVGAKKFVSLSILYLIWLMSALLIDRSFYS